MHVESILERRAATHQAAGLKTHYKFGKRPFQMEVRSKMKECFFYYHIYLRTVWETYYETFTTDAVAFTAHIDVAISSNFQAHRAFHNFDQMRTGRIRHF